MNKSKMTKYILLTFILLLRVGNSYSQRQIPGPRHVNNYNDQWAKEYFDLTDNDEIEGFWQSDDGTKYAIKQYTNENRNSETNTSNKTYRMYISEPNSTDGVWTTGDLRAIIQESSTPNVYSIEYTTFSFPNYFLETDFGFLEKSSLLTINLKDGKKSLLVKIYPNNPKGNTQSPSQNKTISSSGSGFAISSNGYIATNYHVIENATTIEVKGVYGDFSKKYKAELILSDKKNDLAIIKLVDSKFSVLNDIPYTLGLGLAQVGESVFVLGYPMISSMGEEVKLTNGIISSKTGFQGDISTYQISAPVQPGNSGGPLFDMNGNIIGIVNAKHTLAENASYAIKISYLQQLIEMLPQTIKFPNINKLNEKSLTQQVNIASNFTFLILVNDK